MGDRLKKIKYDKLILELQFLKAEIEYNNQLTKDSLADFEKSLQAISKENGSWEDIQRQRKNKPKKGPPPKRAKKKKRLRKKDKELFKKIAKESHPDKLIGLEDDERLKKENNFIKASSALDEGDVSALRAAAQDLGIDPGSLEDSDIEYLEEKIKEASIKNNAIKGSIIWNWVSTDDDSTKDKIVELYIKFLLTKPSA
tara:strand:- start:126 stop:722 length:597 start_codon:yes stop_codon:yes gene_type:complete